MKSVNKIKPEDIEGAQDKEGNTGDNNIRVEMPFIRLMTELFEESIIDELMQSMLAHIRMQEKKTFECLRMVLHEIKSYN